jgi:hypothetical protein
MPTRINERAAEESSRLVLVSFTSLSMRLMEHWRTLIAQVSGKMPDYERTMILGAIITISTEKLIRAELEPNLRNLLFPLPTGMLATCNVTSIAAAVGLNRETVRRKVNELIEDELVSRTENGGLQIGPGLLELPILRETLLAQLELLRRTVNLLSDLNVLQTQAR